MMVIHVQLLMSIIPIANVTVKLTYLIQMVTAFVISLMFAKVEMTTLILTEMAFLISVMVVQQLAKRAMMVMLVQLGMFIMKPVIV